MSDKPRFTLTLTLHDNHGEQRPLTMAIPIDDEVRISSRAVDEMKMGVLGGMDAVVTLMRRREYRKGLFRATCERLGALLAERMEDAEGWHDVERIEPARKQLGGTWR